jgi:hypothetical protein
MKSQISRARAAVANEMVSEAAAHELYGVALTEEGTVAEAATAALRAAR